nr:high mobility group B protein 14 isoform X2 [Ipomoea trifida]
MAKKKSESRERPPESSALTEKNSSKSNEGYTKDCSFSAFSLSIISLAYIYFLRVPKLSIFLKNFQGNGAESETATSIEGHRGRTGQSRIRKEAQNDVEESLQSRLQDA